MAKKNNNKKPQHQESELTLGQLKVMEDSLLKLFRLDLPVEIAFNLSKLIKYSKAELSALEEIRIKLVEKYGENYKSESGSIVIPPDSEEFKKFQEEYSKILERPVDFEFKPVKLQDLKGVQLTSIDVFNLGPVIVE